MLRILLAGVASLALLTAAANAQGASWSTTGTSCTVPGAAAPTIGNVGLPVIGQSYDVTYSGINRPLWPTETRPVLLSGVQQTLFPIPVFSNSQPAGCDILVLPILIDIMGPDPANPIRFATSRTFQVPANSVLIGLPLYHQWVALNQTCLVIGCTANAVLVSELGIATLGV